MIKYDDTKPRQLGQIIQQIGGPIGGKSGKPTTPKPSTPPVIPQPPTTPPQEPSELAKTYQERLASIRKNQEAQASPQPQQPPPTHPALQPQLLLLPGGLDDPGAFPNHLNRSSFIAPIARGRRKFHRQTVIASRADCVLEYTGEQLDEADGELLMALIFFALPYPFGTFVPLNRAQLLRKVKRGTGKHDYEWLHRRLKAFNEATFFLEVRRPDKSTKYRIGATIPFRILDRFFYDGTTETYTYVLDPRWVLMFGNREYALVDWDKHLGLGNMAKSLNRLLATSADRIQRYDLEWLKARAQFSGPMRNFRASLLAACGELERQELITQGTIERAKAGHELLVLRLPSRPPKCLKTYPQSSG